MMFTKEYVREVLEQMVSPYVQVTDEYVDKIYDAFVKIRNGESPFSDESEAAALRQGPGAEGG